MTISMDAALSGLRIAQQQLDVVSGNVANASTPGYTRKILPLETIIIGGLGHGVTSSAITRSVDAGLQKDIYAQQALSQNQTVTQTYLDQIQNFNGASDGTRSLSASVGALAQSFTALSNAPQDTLALANTLAAAQTTAKKFNDFTSLLSQMRNQTETDIGQGVAAVNLALTQVATLNAKIIALRGENMSSADIEDQRDAAIRTVSKYMTVKTSTADNGMMFVFADQGQLLADTVAQPVSFSSSGNLVPGSYYPGGGMTGLFVNGKDIANAPIGGEIGALFKLRDTTIPTYQAQIDELAQKLTTRTNGEGLTLFTDPSGKIPANTAPPLAPAYVGFAGLIQVNAAVIADPTLLRSGTTGGAAQTGSNEVVNRIAQYAFGPYASQQATGSVNLAAGTIFVDTGLTQLNQITGNTAITSYVPALTSNPAIAAGAQFQLTVNGFPHVITIGAGDTALNLVANINAATGFATASLNGLGQLTLTAPSNIILSDITLGVAGINALGFNFANNLPQNPAFTVQVGSQAPVTFPITGATTGASLVASLNALTTVTASLDGAGHLVIIPKDGGSLTLTDTIGQPLEAMGITVTNVAWTPFRTTNVGPGANLSTGLVGNATLQDNARGIMTAQAEDDQNATNTAAQATSYLQTLDKRFSDSSGVNIDQELSNMMRIQSAYTAAAHMMGTSEKLLDELLNIV